MSEDQMVTIIRDEIVRQSEDKNNYDNPWIEVVSPTIIKIDGWLDIQALASAIRNSLQAGVAA